MNWLSWIFICLLSVSFTVDAHGPTPQKAKESIVIDAPIGKVWAVVKEFKEIAKWHPGITESSGDASNEAGSVRKLTLSNGGTLEESLDYYSDSDYEYSYRLKTENVEAFPVSFYTASIKLTENDGKTLVQWKSRFYRGDTGNFPTEKLNDAAAVKAMSEFIKQGLEGLKAELE